MRRILIGQVSLIICCTLYILWWYRGYRPGTTVDRIGGLNGMLLLMTAAFGLAGVIMSAGTVPELYPAKIDSLYLIPAGVVMYVMLLLITRTVFHRVVTTELILIVLWAVLEIAVINKLNAGGFLSDKLFLLMAFVIIAVFDAILRRKNWRDLSLLGSFVISYLGVICMSGFANSERFLLPGLPFLLIMAAYGISILDKSYFKWVKLWYWVVPVMVIGWAVFKLGSRGIL